jgi:hypothetical protein
MKIFRCLIPLLKANGLPAFSPELAQLWVGGGPHDIRPRANPNGVLSVIGVRATGQEGRNSVGVRPWSWGVAGL